MGNQQVGDGLVYRKKSLDDHCIISKQPKVSGDAIRKLKSLGAATWHDNLYNANSKHKEEHFTKYETKDACSQSLNQQEGYTVNNTFKKDFLTFNTRLWASTVDEQTVRQYPTDIQRRGKSK